MIRGWNERMKKVGILLAILFLIPALVLFIYSLFPSRLIPEKDLKRDFDYMLDIVRSAYIDTDEIPTFERRAFSFRRQIKSKMFRFDYYKLVSRLLSELNDSSVNLSFSLPFYMPVMPFKAYPVGNELFVIESVTRDVKPCSRISSVNGESAENLIERLRSYISAESDSMKAWKVSDLFWKLPTLDRLESIELVVNGRAVQLKSITRREYEEKLKEIVGGRKPFSYTEKDGIGILRIRSFSIYKRDLIEWHDLLKNLKTEKLLIDLRSNRGGSFSRARELLEVLLKEPFTLKRDLEIRANRFSKETLERMGITWEEGEILKRNSSISIDGKNGYEGKVWVLLDSHTANTALDFALVLRESGRGKIVGEKPLQKASRNITLTYHALPSVKFGLMIPDARLVYHSDLKVDLLLPQSTEERLIWLCGEEDPYLERVLKEIQ